MKKYPYMICSAAVLCALMLAGCGSSHEKELEQQVAQLQKQVQDLQTDAATIPKARVPANPHRLPHRKNLLTRWMH